MAADMLACSPVGLVLSKQQLNAVADGMSLSAALVSENSHQMLLVNQPQAAEVGRSDEECCRLTHILLSQMAKAWVSKLMGEHRRSKL